MFRDNVAKIEGGAIKWDWLEPTMSNTILENNTALVYGDNIASVAKHLYQLDSPDDINITNVFASHRQHRALISENSTRSDPKINGTLANVQSGGKTSAYFVLIDKYGTVVKTDTTSKIYFK